MARSSFFSRGLGFRNAGIRDICAFVLVGVSTAAVYAGLTWLMMDAFDGPPMVSSSIAYLCSAAWSYLGHRRVTFMSQGSPVAEVRRFTLLTLTGLLVAAGVMKAVVLLHWPALVGVAVVVGLIPPTNYLAMKAWVFKRRGAV